MIHHHLFSEENNLFGRSQPSAVRADIRPTPPEAECGGHVIVAGDNDENATVGQNPEGATRSSIFPQTTQMSSPDSGGNSLVDHCRIMTPEVVHNQEVNKNVNANQEFTALRKCFCQMDEKLVYIKAYGQRMG